MQVAPASISNSIQPVIEISPAKNRKTDYIRTGGQSTTGAVTIVASTPERLFITGAQLSVAKDAACDLATGDVTLSVTPKGDTSRSILGISVLVSTAQSDIIAITFKDPIEIESGSAITIGSSATFGAGLCRRNGRIFGYISDGDAL